MFKTLPILLLVAATHCQSDSNLGSEITDIFGPPTSQANGKAQTSNILSLIQTNAGAPEGKISSNQFGNLLSNQQQREGCGWANPDGAYMRNVRVFNDETKFGEFPWMVAILKVEPEGKKLNEYIGGGCLIHPSVVLTGAHNIINVKIEALRIRAGEWGTQNTKEIYPFQERKVASIETHKDFGKGKRFYECDISIAFLAQPVTLTSNVGLVCLPPPSISQRERVRCFATGWGQDNFGRDGGYGPIMQKIELPVLEHDECQAILRKTHLGKHFQLHSTFMCAGGEPGKDACKGDGGAPLSCPIENENNRYVVSGIGAWGIGCGENGTPGVYVEVSVIRDWVDDIVVRKGYDPKIYTY